MTKKGILPPLSERDLYTHTYLINIKYINFQNFNATEIRLNFFLTVNTSAINISLFTQGPPPYISAISMQEIISIFIGNVGILQLLMYSAVL